MYGRKRHYPIPKNPFLKKPRLAEDFYQDTFMATIPRPEIVGDSVVMSKEVPMVDVNGLQYNGEAVAPAHRGAGGTFMYTKSETIVPGLEYPVKGLRYNGLPITQGENGYYKDPYEDFVQKDDGEFLMYPMPPPCPEPGAPPGPYDDYDVDCGDDVSRSLTKPGKQPVTVIYNSASKLWELFEHGEYKPLSDIVQWNIYKKCGAPTTTITESQQQPAEQPIPTVEPEYSVDCAMPGFATLRINNEPVTVQYNSTSKKWIDAVGNVDIPPKAQLMLFQNCKVSSVEQVQAEDPYEGLTVYCGDVGAQYPPDVKLIILKDGEKIYAQFKRVENRWFDYTTENELPDKLQYAIYTKCGPPQFKDPDASEMYDDWNVVCGGEEGYASHEVTLEKDDQTLLAQFNQPEKMWYASILNGVSLVPKKVLSLKIQNKIYKSCAAPELLVGDEEFVFDKGEVEASVEEQKQSQEDAVLEEEQLKLFKPCDFPSSTYNGRAIEGLGYYANDTPEWGFNGTQAYGVPHFVDNSEEKIPLGVFLKYVQWESAMVNFLAARSPAEGAQASTFRDMSGFELKTKVSEILVRDGKPMLQCMDFGALGYGKETGSCDIYREIGRYMNANYQRADKALNCQNETYEREDPSLQPNDEQIPKGASDEQVAEIDERNRQNAMKRYTKPAKIKKGPAGYLVYASDGAPVVNLRGEIVVAPTYCTTLSFDADVTLDQKIKVPDFVDPDTLINRFISAWKKLGLETVYNEVSEQAVPSCKAFAETTLAMKQNIFDSYQPSQAEQDADYEAMIHGGQRQFEDSDTYASNNLRELPVKDERFDYQKIPKNWKEEIDQFYDELTFSSDRSTPSASEWSTNNYTGRMLDQLHILEEVMLTKSLSARERDNAFKEWNKLQAFIIGQPEFNPFWESLSQKYLDTTWVFDVAEGAFNLALTMGGDLPDILESVGKGVAKLGDIAKKSIGQFTSIIKTATPKLALKAVATKADNFAQSLTDLAIDGLTAQGRKMNFLAPGALKVADDALKNSITKNQLTKGFLSEAVNMDAIKKSSSFKMLDEDLLQQGFLKKKNSIIGTAALDEGEFTVADEIATRLAKNPQNEKAIMNDLETVLTQATTDSKAALQTLNNMDDPLVSVYPLVDKLNMAKTYLTGEALETMVTKFKRQLGLIAAINSNDQLAKMRKDWIEKGEAPDALNVASVLKDIVADY